VRQQDHFSLESDLKFMQFLSIDSRSRFFQPQ